MKTQDYQTILTFGYVYIIILGILKEAFFYSQIGIDYFKYCSITDILISPISDITASITMILVFLFLIILAFGLPIWLSKKKDKSWFKKNIKIGEGKENSSQEIQNTLTRTNITGLAFALLGFYIGIGIGSGIKVSQKIKNEKIKYEDQLSYINGQIDTVYLIEKNSSFLFYIPKDKKEIEIAPINNGMLKSIIEQ
jgi:hypothetical protein